VEFLPEDPLVMDDMEKAKLAYPEKCNGFGMCELRCPDLTTKLKFGKGLKYSNKISSELCMTEGALEGVNALREKRESI